MYKDAAWVHFIFDVVCAIHFITVAKSEMYCMGVKSMALWLTFFYTKAILFSPCHYILLFATVMKWIAYTIFNLKIALFSGVGESSGRGSVAEYVLYFKWHRMYYNRHLIGKNLQFTIKNSNVPFLTDPV